MNIRPVILAGGSGVRLWPLSRENTPKQLLPLLSERTLLQETLLRVRGGLFLSPIIICSERYRFLVAEQVRDVGFADASIVLEPVARNSCAAAAVASLISEQVSPDAVALVLPSDHAIGDTAGFHKAVQTASGGARAGYLMTFGVEPTRPATEYGYIRVGAALASAAGCSEVAEFIEKPDAARARELLALGGTVWNSGMFLFNPGVFLEELERFEPAIARAAKSAVEKSGRDLGFIRLDAEAFSHSPNISIDYAVMERTRRAATCPLGPGWSDLGSWSAIWEAAPRDQAGNVLQGDVLLEEARGCMVRSDGALTAVLGVDDIVVITTDDAVLVTTKARAQEVRKIVGRLAASNRSEHREGVETHRPWGKFKRIDAGQGYQVKLITVLPGTSISLQLHNRRSEHWVVVSGAGTVTRGDETFELETNKSTFIPAGIRHRLENHSAEPLRIVEVQSGDYLGEDDIVRFDDRYGRNTAS
jgi:mannose-1-phosphate guanylyltransferase / mannose-6-phosphate isomerase